MAILSPVWVPVRDEIGNGAYGNGCFKQTAGSVMLSGATVGTLRNGEKVGGRGDYNLNSGSLKVPGGLIYVGQEGDGNLEMKESTGPASISANGLVAGNNPGSYGDIFKEGGSITLTQNL